MTGLYLACLLVSAACVALLDRRWRLAAWRAVPGAGRRTSALVAAGSALLIVWDLVAIALGFYGRGESDAMLGVWLAPHLPLEEVVFVAFLSYVTLVVAGAVARALDRGAVRGSTTDRLREQPSTQQAGAS